MEAQLVNLLHPPILFFMHLFNGKNASQSDVSSGALSHCLGTQPFFAVLLSVHVDNLPQQSEA